MAPDSPQERPERPSADDLDLAALLLVLATSTTPNDQEADAALRVSRWLAWRAHQRRHQGWLGVFRRQL